MADALAPWLLDYVLSVSETYGANLSNAQPHTKGKKVQVTEFLTYDSEAEDSLLWARISDKQYIIPVKFTRGAMAQYSQQSTKRFTQHKTAVITIKSFRLIITRIPLGTHGMSSQPSLAIECPSFSVLGSSGEATFGHPKPITDHPDMYLWSEGLKHDGGAGNVLKERKMHQQLNEPAQVIQPPKVLPEGRRSPIFKRNINQPIPCEPANTSIVSYMNKWQFIEKTHAYRRLPQPINAPPDRTLDGLASNLENGDAPKTQHCPTSSGWDCDETLGVPLTEPNSSNNAFSSSSIPAPTPAQRIKASNIPERESYSGHGSMLRKSDDLMAQQAVSRKIPRPTSPVPYGHTESPIRILAPNSDTSSQPISQTQSQLRQLSDRVPVESTINHKDSQALLLGVTIDLKGEEYPFLNLLRMESDGYFKGVVQCLRQVFTMNKQRHSIRTTKAAGSLFSNIMRPSEHSSFARRFKLDYVQPALQIGNAYFNDRPILTTFLAIFLSLSILPVLAFLGTVLLAIVSFILIALVVAIVASLAVFLVLSVILASVLLGAFFASAFFTVVAITLYLFLRLFALVREGGVSGVSEWACEIKSHLNMGQNSAYGCHSQSPDNRSDTNESVVVVHENEASNRSSDYHDYHDEDVYDVKAQED